MGENWQTWKSTPISDKLLDSDAAVSRLLNALHFPGRCRRICIRKETNVNRAFYTATEIQFSESLENTQEGVKILCGAHSVGSEFLFKAVYKNLASHLAELSASSNLGYVLGHRLYFWRRVQTMVKSETSTYSWRENYFRQLLNVKSEVSIFLFLCLCENSILFLAKTLKKRLQLKQQGPCRLRWTQQIGERPLTLCRQSSAYIFLNC